MIAVQSHGELQKTKDNKQAKKKKNAHPKNTKSQRKLALNSSQLSEEL